MFYPILRELQISQYMTQLGTKLISIPAPNRLFSDRFRSIRVRFFLTRPSQLPSHREPLTSHNLRLEMRATATATATACVSLRHICGGFPCIAPSRFSSSLPLHSPRLCVFLRHNFRPRQLFLTRTYAASFSSSSGYNHHTLIISNFRRTYPVL